MRAMKLCSNVLERPAQHAQVYDNNNTTHPCAPHLSITSRMHVCNSLATLAFVMTE